MGRACSTSITGRKVKAMKPVKKDSPTKQEASVSTKEEVVRARQQLSPIFQAGINWIVDYLAQHKSEILICKANLEAGAIRAQCEVVEAEHVQEGSSSEIMPDVWHKTYVMCLSIPKYYIADFLVRICDFDQDLVDRIDSKCSKDGLRKAFGFLTGLHENMHWCSALHVRLVLTAFCTEQVRQLEDRVQNFPKHVSPDGTVDYDSMCPFSLTWSLPPSRWPKTWGTKRGRTAARGEN